MKRLIVFFAFVFLLVATSSVNAKTTAKVSDYPETKELPWFLTNIAQEKVPADQMKEYLRDMNATWNCFQGNPNGMGVLIPGEDSYRVTFTDMPSTAAFTLKPQTLTIVLDHYVQIASGPDKGKFRFTDFCGREKALTQHEVDVIISYILHKEVIRPVKIDADFWAPVIHKGIVLGVEKRVPKDKVSEYLAKLDQNVPGYDITFREYWALPREHRLSDNTPRELHVGYNLQLPGIFGVAWLDTGLVYLNPQAVQMDYMKESPQVAMHEFMHTNSNIQSYPLAEAFDVELVASVPMMFLSDDQIDFFFHGYAAVFRKLAKVYFGYDFNQAREENVAFNDATGNLHINEAKWNENFKKLEEIKKEFLTVFTPDAFSQFLSDRMLWLSMNNKRVDKNAYLRIMMAKHFEACGLGGCKATKQWEEANKDEIIRITRESMEELEKGGGGGGMSDMMVPKYLVDLYERTFTQAEREQIESHYRAHPEELTRLLASQSEFFKAVQSFKHTESKGGLR